MNAYLARPLAFPDVLPKGFAPLEREPVFDPAKHLQIERPQEVLNLAQLGYSAQEIAACPSDFGVTSIFRVLSDEGAAAMLEVGRSLEQFCTSNARISRNVRGGVYRSKFLRDLCLSEEVSQTMSDIAGLPLLPHTIPHQLGHLNYNPKTVGENVDKWHCDTLRYDFVMFVTDPKSVQGGEFEYYKGTKAEVAALQKAGKPLDPAKIVAPDMPGPGYAVLQQGNMVVHRAKGLTAPGERITMVNGYVPRDVNFPDYSRLDQLALADPMDVAASEYARHVQWMARERMQAAIEGFAFREDNAEMAREMQRFSQELSAAAVALETAGDGEIEHFGDG